MSHLKWIGFALHNYHDHHGHFPPAYTVDEEDKRLHSWRTLILPYLEQQSLYDSIDLTKSWDDPANAKARAATLEVFTCPASYLEPGMTTYLAPVGPNWAFAGETPRSLSDFIDGTSRTIFLVEVDQEQAVHWMSPYDYDEDDGFPFFDIERPGVHTDANLVAYADGHVSPIQRDIDPEDLRKRLTIAGKEKLDD